MLNDVVCLNLKWVYDGVPFAEFFVPGAPATAGSKQVMLHPTLRKCLSSPEEAARLPELLRDEALAKKMRRAMVIPDNKDMVSWRYVVASAACQAWLPNSPLQTGAILVEFEYVIARRKGDFGSGGNADKLKASAPRWSEVKPDVGKFTRCMEDALTGILWRDDAQVAFEVLAKRYADLTEIPGVHVRAYQLHQCAEPKLL